MNLPPNYIADQNRFKLAGPPAYFRRALWAFDDSLVVVPSRQDFLYRLAQRRPLSLPQHIVNEALFNSSDTQMLSTYGLVPVTTILATVNWANPTLIEQLRQRAPHRNGGASEVIARMEAQERAAELKKREQNEEIADQVAKDSWLMYNKKIGTRSNGFAIKTPNAPSAPKNAPSVRTANKTAANPQLVSIFSR